MNYRTIMPIRKFWFWAGIWCVAMAVVVAYAAYRRMTLPPTKVILGASDKITLSRQDNRATLTRDIHVTVAGPISDLFKVKSPSLIAPGENPISMRSAFYKNELFVPSDATIVAPLEWVSHSEFKWRPGIYRLTQHVSYRSGRAKVSFGTAKFKLSEEDATKLNLGKQMVVEIEQE